MNISGREVRYPTNETVLTDPKELIVRFTDEGNWFITTAPVGADVNDGVFIDSDHASPDVVMAVSALFHAIRANRQK